VTNLSRIKAEVEIHQIDADFQNVEFKCVEFQNVDFQNVSFQNVDFQNVDFQNVDFQNFDLIAENRDQTIDPLLSGHSAIPGSWSKKILTFLVAMFGGLQMLCTVTCVHFMPVHAESCF
jgi:hypothetical protein